MKPETLVEAQLLVAREEAEALKGLEIALHGIAPAFMRVRKAAAGQPQNGPLSVMYGQLMDTLSNRRREVANTIDQLAPEPAF